TALTGNRFAAVATHLSLRFQEVRDVAFGRTALHFNYLLAQRAAGGLTLLDEDLVLVDHLLGLRRGSDAKGLAAVLTLDRTVRGGGVAEVTAALDAEVDHGGAPGFDPSVNARRVPCPRLCVGMAPDAMNEEPHYTVAGERFPLRRGFIWQAVRRLL